MDTSTITTIIILICTHSMVYSIGRLVELNEHRKKLNMLKEQMNKIKAMKKEVINNELT